jgi:crotonobetainyl-CoA:carnitine CoA-transferase CaiB-like acyl-CoA transferase
MRALPRDISAGNSTGRSSQTCKKHFARSRAYWLERLDANNVPNAPINSIEEVFDDPQVNHMEIPKQIEHPKMGKTNLIGSPINLSDTPAQFFRPAPLLGNRRMKFCNGSVTAKKRSKSCAEAEWYENSLELRV